MKLEELVNRNYQQLNDNDLYIYGIILFIIVKSVSVYRLMN